jgi:hypothetical protein
VCGAPVTDSDGVMLEILERSETLRQREVHYDELYSTTSSYEYIAITRSSN